MLASSLPPDNIVKRRPNAAFVHVRALQGPSPADMHHGVLYVLYVLYVLHVG